MVEQVLVDTAGGRKWTLDEPADLGVDEPVTFILNLHGGGSVGAWQRAYFPASDLVDRYRLVVAAPSAATRAPIRYWSADAADAHLRAVAEQVFDRYGRDRIASFWLAGHSQGGMTSHRLLNDPWWRDRVDGFLSLSGGRFGPVEVPESFFAPHRAAGYQLPANFRTAARPGATVPDGLDISFIFTTGEHEAMGVPDTSILAERYGAGPRERRDDVVDDQPGKIHDTRYGDRSTPAWGMLPGPGRAEVYAYPDAANGRLVADVVRINKGHTEGLEPNVTEALVRMMVEAPGGRARTAA